MLCAIKQSNVINVQRLLTQDVYIPFIDCLIARNLNCSCGLVIKSVQFRWFCPNIYNEVKVVLDKFYGTWLGGYVHNCICYIYILSSCFRTTTNKTE